VAAKAFVHQWSRKVTAAFWIGGELASMSRSWSSRSHWSINRVNEYSDLTGR
jgi:hypothetical protein